ncbi:hypothetical protein ACWKWZ_22605 [Metapseudomonas otitidis]
MSDITHEQLCLQQLFQGLDARLHTTLEIAEVILENVFLQDGVPGPFLDGYREGALMGALIHLSRNNYEDYLRLVEMVGLPLGRQVP